MCKTLVLRKHRTKTQGTLGVLWMQLEIYSAMAGVEKHGAVEPARIGAPHLHSVKSLAQQYTHTSSAITAAHPGIMLCDCRLGIIKHQGRRLNVAGIGLED